MSSQPPILPPSLLSGASAQAKIDQIAVRIITAPENARNESSPAKLSGVVRGQNPDGTLNIQTDRGDIRILLRDKGNLPQGLKIEIDIPAGRNVQQASIRPNPNLTNTHPLPAPTLQQALNTTPTPPTTQAPLPIQSETLGNIITSSQSQTVKDTIPATIPIAGGALQVGQMIRLLPIPPQDIAQNVLANLAKPIPFPVLLNELVTGIETLPASQNQLKSQMINVLSRLDFSGLEQPKPLPDTLLKNATTPQQSLLVARINALLQSAGLPSVALQGNLSTPLIPAGGKPSPQLQTIPLSLFNPSKPVDGQVIAFQGTASLLATALPSSSQPTQNTPVSPAQILGATSSGLPILSVPLPQTGLSQIYTMQFGANNVKTGTSVFIALDPTSTKSTNSLFVQMPDGTITLNPVSLKTNFGTWDSFDDVLKTLTHLSPAQGQAFANIIPSPAQPQNMGALSLFFLSLMRSGDTDGWIANEAVTLLRQVGKTDLLRAVVSDMATTARLDTIPLAQDWRMTMLPMLWNNDIQKLPLYYKHFSDDQNKDADADKKRRKLRFLFDLNLTRMGGVQVDGFMQSERLDIILRTKSPLSPPMQSQMKRIYAGAMDKSRLNGDLSFQFKPEHWVDFSQPLEKTGVHA